MKCISLASFVAVTSLTFSALALAADQHIPSNPTNKQVIEASKASALKWQEKMRAQRPLVTAARKLQDTIKQSSGSGYNDGWDDGSADGFDSGYAGIIIEENKVVLWWKGSPPSAVQASVKEISQSTPIEIRAAKYSRDELYAAADHIRQSGLIDGVNHLKDPGDGSRLVVSMGPERKADMSILAKSLPDVGVTLDFVYEEKMQKISRLNDTAPWSGGARIINTSIGAGCTSGFGVLVDGAPAILTAGHCATANGQSIANGSGNFIGYSTQKTNHDQMIVPTTSTNNLMYYGAQDSSSTKTVVGWEPVFIGELLCQAGITTAGAIGSELCGLRVTRFFTDSESLIEAEQIDGQTGARPGDSGGPLYSDLGSTVIAKGTMTWVSGNRVGFQDFPTAVADFGAIEIPGGGSSTGKVTLYQHCNYSGQSASFDVGSFDVGALINSGLANDDISSVRVSPNHSITLYQHGGFSGESITLTGDDSCLTDNNANGVNFNDQISSFRVDSTAVVTLYQDCNFSGSSASFALGDFNLAALQAAGIQNDDVSSVKVSNGYSVTLYQHNSYGGASVTLSGNDSCLTDNNAGGVNFNDQVSSMKVQVSGS